MLDEVSPVHRTILQVLAGRGGRLRPVDVALEMRRGCIGAQEVGAGLRTLLHRGFVRGPSATVLEYELTDTGWLLVQPGPSIDPTGSLEPQPAPIDEVVVIEETPLPDQGGQLPLLWHPPAEPPEF